MDEIGQKLIKKMKANDKKIITKPSKAFPLLDENAKLILEEEILATNLFSYLYGQEFQKDYLLSPVIQKELQD